MPFKGLEGLKKNAYLHVERLMFSTTTRQGGPQFAKSVSLHFLC